MKVDKQPSSKLGEYRSFPIITIRLSLSEVDQGVRSLACRPENTQHSRVSNVWKRAQYARPEKVGVGGKQVPLADRQLSSKATHDAKQSTTRRTQPRRSESTWGRGDSTFAPSAIVVTSDSPPALHDCWCELPSNTFWPFRLTIFEF